MKATLSKLASSLMGLLVTTEKVSDSVLDNRCEDIREAMLTLLGQCRRDAATDRCQREQGNPGEEHPAAAEEVAESASIPRSGALRQVAPCRRWGVTVSTAGLQAGIRDI